MNLDPWYQTLTIMHVSTIVPAFFIATYMLLTKKGTAGHKVLGRIYMVLMLFTSLVSLFMSSQIGPNILSHFGYIHLFSVLTLYAVPTAYFAIKAGNVKKHKFIMIGLYTVSLLVAGSLALTPGRFLGDLIFS